ncbi:MAG: hypothetical protein HQL31_01290 [Planctomycetes bacterium]|nr:hypothetical protein [Planctomycetota bacterium]
MSKISKIDAARRQLETAITLFFNSKDPISIHTLSAASSELCNDLLSDHLDKDGWMDILVKSAVKPEFQKEFKCIMRKAQNFFKHADKDPKAIFDYKSLITEIHLFFTIDDYRRLTGERTPLMLIYQSWYMLSNPHHFQDEFKKQLEQFSHINPSDKLSFYSDSLAIRHRIF